MDIHADDYALTINTSEEILSLMREGVLDSISIVPNNDCYDTCLEMLRAAIPELPFLPKMSVHLNLVEGHSLSSGDDSLITSTWKSLFIDSFNPFARKRAKDRIREEISAQISRTWNDIQGCIIQASAHNITCSQAGLRIDSHQHTHMIPIVWDALTECLNEADQKVEYIRNSKEPLMPFISHASLWSTYRPVNIIKNRILNTFSHRPDRYDRLEGHKPMYLWGLVMSGKMDKDRIEKLYPSMVEKAQNDGRELEILFHPGRMTKDELCQEIPVSSAEEFYLSSNRDTEKGGVRYLYNIEYSGRV